MNSWMRNVGTGSSEQDFTGADMSSRSTSFSVDCRKHDSDDEQARIQKCGLGAVPSPENL